MESHITSLPEDIIIDILARVPRRHYPTVSLVSKHFRSLVASPDIYASRSLLRCTEHFLYVFLYNWDKGGYRLYTLCRKADGQRSRLVPIPCPPLVSEHVSLAAVGPKIYVFGGFNYHDKRSTAYSIDCRSHTKQPLPSLHNVLLFLTVADVIDDRIYVIGYGPYGSKDYIYDKEKKVVVVVFNTKTEMWEPGMTNLDVPGRFMPWKDGCVAMANKIYTNKFVYDPKETKWVVTDDEMLRSKTLRRACAIDDVMYYHDYSENKLIAYDSKTSCWKVVQGLEEFLAETKSKEWTKTVRYGEKLVLLFTIEDEITGVRACLSVFLKNLILRDAYKHALKREICCAQISLERRQGGQIFGKVEWFDHDLIDGDFKILDSLTVII